jgi:hypothetical protein
MCLYFTNTRFYKAKFDRVVSVEVIVAIAFGLAATILSIGAIFVTMRHRYIRIFGKHSSILPDSVIHTDFMVVDPSDLERQRPPPDSEPPHTAAIKLLEIVFALVSSPAITPYPIPGARNFIELEDQPTRG